MRLKKLVVQGYKTFANKTEFLFDEGITAIVGPNGSGKSNVADAVRWVLGEQSYSELRGKRTIDMIFAGSPTRPRAGMASAVLTLDNSNGWLPIDYAEVEIGRKAYRTGENEYYINGTRVRLRDVRELLATSGLAQRTYTMIGQGLVDRALSLKSDERRALFEEAAGISHYKDRRAESLRRLQETQRNITRVNDVLAEIEPRLRSLKRQANRAENYEQLQKDLHHLLRQWYGFHWEAERGKLRTVRAAAAEAETAWKASRRKLVAYQTQMDDARRRLNYYQAQITEKEAARDSLREQLEHARRQVAILTERQSLVARQLSEINEDLPDLELQQRQAQSELESATTALTEVQTQLNSEKLELTRFEKTYQAQQAEIGRQQRLVQTLERDFQQAQRAASQAEGQLTQLRERLAEREGQTVDSAEEAQTAERLDKLNVNVKTLQEQLKSLRAERKSLNDARQKLIRDVKQLRRDQTDRSRRANAISKEVARLEERARLLDQMRQQTGDIKGRKHIIGRIADRLTIPKQHQAAIETALQARLATLLVKDERALWQLLGDNKGVALATMPESVATVASTQPAAPAQRGVIGWAADVVESADATLKHIVLGHILLVEDAQTAWDVAGQLPIGCVAASADGLLVHAGGLVEQRELNARDSVLKQEAAWREALAAVEAKQAQFDDAQKAARALRGEIDGKQDEIDKLNNDERKLGSQDQRSGQQLSKLQRDVDRLQQQLTFFNRQKETRERDLGRLKQRIEQLEQSRGKNSTQIGTYESQLADARVVLAALPVAEGRQQRAQLQQQMAATRTIVDGRRAVVDSRRATLGQVENRLSRQRQRLATLRNQQREINLAEEQSKLDGLQKQMTLIADELHPLQSMRRKLQGELSDVEADFSIHQKDAHRTEETYTEARLSLSHQINHIDNLRERIRSDLGIVDLSYDEDETVQAPLQLTEVVEKLPTIEALPLGIDESIQKRRGQLQRIGAVNPDAPQEYRETLERYEFMKAQIADLLETEAQLRRVIADLDELTSLEFAKTVERVNGIFADMFTRLFGGGSAELKLTDPDNLTVSGVDILAQLPRRRTQGLGLLSGGERSLTAAALIFALLKVTPPPFCAMDEVDAALDEANINRFRDVLRELSLRTQFIVITHNRGTVQAANTIYGISMGNDSSSQVISIKPEDYINSEFNESADV